MTFREVGEGTGQSIDLDEYDAFYYNLFIWDRDAQEIVGGYRAGCGDEIFQQRGIDGFYIHSLFEIEEGAYPILQQSVELGRSYIVPAYQRAYLPFFLLWRGILLFLLQNVQYRYLIGPVSISKYYSDTCKRLIIEFVQKHYLNTTLAPFFRPRTPFEMAVKHVGIHDVNGNSLKDLESFLSTIEPEHVRLPVLLKQYTKLNARFISFNLDPNFSDALDGLMILDLQEIPEEIITLLQEK